ncbi:MAG: hypothetical protein AB1603_01675 [Chloroflexota bacterium]
MVEKLSPVREKLAAFCDSTCPVCTNARKHQKGFDYWFVKNIDRAVCPACKSYENKYGVRAYEPHP